MILGKILKQPAESFPVSITFAELEAAETITGQTISARNALTGADTTTTMLGGSPSISGSKLSQRVINGTSGDEHIVQFRITTSMGNTYEHEIVVKVTEA